ncbi:helix-turn-helix domain-containing protein [Actinoplanes sp. NPDC023801]|uniref:ATP-binding protein n=1 Tax=Actinoplanes sp. NPDC023801 TaxID=3154595 RepID=UPI003400A89A
MAIAAPAGALGELMRRHRATAGLSQRELAASSGLSERAVRDLERGSRVPRNESVRLAAAALQLTGDDLRVFLAAARPDTVPAATVPPPVPDNDLVGRDTELAMLLDMMIGARHRLVTVTGRAGIGKSRLATELVAALAGRTDLAVRTLDLSAVGEPELVGELVADALGCGPSRLPVADRVAAHLRGARTVLAIDRFEQVIDAAPVLAALVRRCPGLSLVVTSQRRLQVRGERAVPLGPLAADAAMTLFTRRAAAAGPGFRLGRDTAGIVATICRAAEHLPLAIELAAARTRLMHPAELAARLDRHLTVLADGARDLPVRHRSLRAAIDASLEVIEDGSLVLFRWLGAFVGGARLADVEAVAADLGRGHDWLLAGLTELTDMHLLRVSADGATSRYMFADSIAEVAAERLAAADDRDAVARAVAVRVLEQLRAGFDGSAPALGNPDAATVRHAVRWALEREPGLLASSTVIALGRFHEATGRLAEGREMLSRVAAAGHAEGWVRAGGLAAMQGDIEAAADLARRGLRAAAPADHSVRSAALTQIAVAAIENGDPATARTHLREALVEARRAGDVATLGRVFNNLASASVERGDARSAERQLRAALTAKRRSGAGPLDIGRTLFNLAEICLELNQPDTAVTWSSEAVPLLRAAGFARLAALSEATAAQAELIRGRVDAAMCAADRAARLLPGDDGDRRIHTLVRLRSSVVRHAAGELPAARDALREALSDSLEHLSRDREEVADALQMHAGHVVGRDPAVAARLLGASDRLRRRELGWLVPARRRTEQAARLALGDEDFARCRQAGAALDHEGLVALCDEIARLPQPPLVR